MKTTPQKLGFIVKSFREKINLTQQKFAEIIGEKAAPTLISNLENGKMPNDINMLKKICEALELPKPLWQHLLDEKYFQRINFERMLEELCGESISTDELDDTIISVLENEIKYLFQANLTPEQRFDCLNSIVVYYGLQPLSKPFFDRYMKKDSFRTLGTFEEAIEGIKTDAIRLFSSINTAYLTLNSQNEEEFNRSLLLITERDTDNYTKRTDWNRIEKISNEDLPYLGYIAAEKVKQEEKERKELSNFLLEVAKEKKEGKFTFDTSKYTTKKKRKMETLLRKFESNISTGLLFQRMFPVDVETLKQEAEHISPKEEDLNKIEQTQSIAYHNLSNYLAADYMDVYVATSMRSDADFVSVNQFVEALFCHNSIRQLKLRYFNPTQSWIEDRVAKGLVEALMLKRADLCIYMAQKEDTFGKDSEASVTLGQGKPVIVYVPKLSDSVLGIDTETLGKITRDRLIEELKALDPNIENEIDIVEDDNGALHATLIHKKLEKATDDDYIRIITTHWADFDIEGEFKKRLNEKDCSIMKKWLQDILSKTSDIEQLTEDLRKELKNILVATAMNFERRAKIFREVHPLALQIILDSGVLNGILVVRSIDSCAELVKSLIENKLSLRLYEDTDNYKLIEENTGSVIRVISKHKLIANSFKTYYNKEKIK